MPYPSNDGGKLCVYGFIDYLRHNHSIHLLLSAGNDEDKRNIKLLENHWPEVTISHVDLFHPPVKLSKKEKLKSFVKQCLRTLFNLFKTHQSIESKDPYGWFHVFRTTPFYPHHVRFIQKLEFILTRTKFDIIQTELTWMLNLIHLFPSDSKKVFVQIE